MAEGPPCNTLQARTNGLFDTDLDCKNFQLEHYQKGCCPMPPFDHCSYCKDPNSVPDMDMTVPTGQFVDGYNCFDYSYQAQSRIGMFEDGTCSDTFLQRAGHYCGCPGQEQQCWLCPDGKPPSKPARGDAFVTQGTCRGIEYLYSLFTEEECGIFPFEAGADLAIFCGCGGLNQTEIDEQAAVYTCSLCENDGGTVTNPGFVWTTTEEFSRTCQQAEDFARDIIKTPRGCANPKHFEKARAACTCSSVSSGGVGVWSPWSWSSSSLSSSVVVGTTAVLLLLGSAGGGPVL